MINFIIGSVYWIPTLYPLAITARQMGQHPIFYVRKNIKDYADPMASKFKDVKACCRKHSIELLPIKDITSHPGLTFLVEGDISGRSTEDLEQSGLKYLNATHRKVSLVWNFDFFWTYPKYIDRVDYVVFPNEIYAKTYNRLSPKNVYIGSSKYELSEQITHDVLIQKFKLIPKKSYALVFYPKYT